jgi:coatomer subunit beta
MEKQCTYLIFDERVARAEPSELAKDLESSDVKVKVATMKKIIILMLNGEQLGSLLMRVIQYVVPNEVCAPATTEGGFCARAHPFPSLPHA